MANGKFVAYYRVSTREQGESGLGLEAQREAVRRYLNGGDWQLLGEFTEVETGKGRESSQNRPQLKAAMAQAKRLGATLLIAKLDRLARNVSFIANLMDDGVEFVCADMPQANKTMLQMFSVMVEWERDAISARTKAGLAAAKARGVKLGNPANLKPTNGERAAAAKTFADNLAGVIQGMRLRGLLQREMVAELNQLGIKTPAGKTGCWQLTQLQRVLARLPAAQACEKVS